MLYIRRRNQILQDKAKHSDNMEIRDQYLKRRLMALTSKYGPLERKLVFPFLSSCTEILRHRARVQDLAHQKFEMNFHNTFYEVIG
jgi:hypothetical protein